MILSTSRSRIAGGRWLCDYVIYKVMNGLFTTSYDPVIIPYKVVMYRLVDTMYGIITGTHSANYSCAISSCRRALIVETNLKIAGNNLNFYNKSFNIELLVVICFKLVNFKIRKHPIAILRGRP